MQINTGLDYGRLRMSDGQLPNRNPETGIRYGIASQHDLADEALDDFEPVYSQGCPYCGEECPEEQIEDFVCPACSRHVELQESWGDEPVDSRYDDGELVLRLDQCGDVWILKSPVTTTGRHCSPCAPGAVTVTREPVPGGPRAYTLPEEWWAEKETP